LFHQRILPARGGARQSRHAPVSSLDGVALALTLVTEGVGDEVYAEAAAQFYER
jgi:hypothetical protein